MTHPALTTLSQEEKLFRDTVLGFARERVAPHVARMDEEGALDKSLLPGLFEMGLMGIEVPTEYGGAGGTFFDAILAVEALATIDPSVSVLVDVQNTLVLNAILRWGNEAQKARYLPRMTSSWIGSYALSEASSGSDAFALKARATRKDGGWVLNGRKLWITNANESSLFLVLATVDPGLGYKGITAFLVEREFPGFSVGKKENKLGIRASSTCELVLEDCFVPDENVLGEIGKGYKIAIETLNEGRIGIGAQMLGLAQGAFEYSVRYMNERKQFGQSIASFQGVQFQYARVAMEIEAARLMVYNAARLKDEGKPFLKEAAMAKLFASEVAERTASLAVEFLGGVGFTKEYPIEKFYRDAKIGKIYEGTSNLQLQTIAKIVQAEFGGKLQICRVWGNTGFPAIILPESCAVETACCNVRGRRSPVRAAVGQGGSSKAPMTRSYRTASLALGLIFSTSLASAEPTAADQARDQLLDRQTTAMSVLGGWTLLSVGTGAGLWALGRTSFVRAMGVQQVAWGGIDGLIAGLSYRGILADRRRSEPLAYWAQERGKLRTILGVNVALDVAYLAVGASLLAFGRRESVRGVGAGILPQGAFLLVFDSAFLISL
jgi:alkylation response protein AidB-like acyl-CoA dehydrogenase